MVQLDAAVGFCYDPYWTMEKINACSGGHECEETQSNRLTSNYCDEVVDYL